MATLVMLCLVFTLVAATTQSKDISSQGLDMSTIVRSENRYNINNEPLNALFQNWENKPEMRPAGHSFHIIYVLYETMCPKSRELFTQHLREVQNRLQDYVYVSTFAYGKATTTTHLNGSITFECPHGEAECYGNKLHACANDFYLGDYRVLTLEYTTCLMEFGSNDDAVDKCGHRYNIDVPILSFIKSCAKDIMGSRLLQWVGEVSMHMVEANHIPSDKPLPYVLIGDKPWDGKYEDLIKYICALIADDDRNDDGVPDVCNKQK